MSSDATHHYSCIASFEGGITTRVIAHPQYARTRCFAYEVTLRRSHPRVAAAAATHGKPPRHFHPAQEEYVQVLRGRLAVERDGQTWTLAPEDGEFCIKRWKHHRLYAPPLSAEEEGEEEGGSDTVFLLSAQETADKEAFRLDTVFFENWYAYQDEVVLRGKRVDPVQVMSMFDAGGSYLSLPWWVPFNRRVSRAMGIVVGRWLGGLLGYQPFYKKWTTDWELACRKMETSVFQRRFADRAKTG